MACGSGYMKLAFDRTNPEAVAWAERHAAELVTRISADTREVIRLMVAESFEAGIPPRDLARMIRSTIGLTPRDARAVLNFRKRLMGDATRNDIVQRKTERYADKLIRKRALDIAITESNTAANEGQRALWRQAIEKGYLSPSAKKTLVVADPCPICAPMTGEVVPVDAEFSGGLPPFHVRCKCFEGLVH